MKTFDRAMYAIFLLVLLADGARAQSPVPGAIEGTEISGGVMLHGALNRVSEMQADRAAMDGRDESPSGASRSVRGIGTQLLSGYQSTAKPAHVIHVGPSRNLFDGYNFVVLSVVSQVPESESVLSVSAALESPRPAVVEHSGSPAP